MKRVWYRVLSIALPAAVIFAIYYAPYFAAAVYWLIAALSPLWLAPLLLWAAWPLWVHQREAQFLARVWYRTYEIIPGASNTTPKEMERVLTQLYSRVDITKEERFFMGVVRAPWSLELTASGGLLRMFVTVPTDYAPQVLHALRESYPDIDYNETDDFASSPPSTFSVVVREYTLKNPDPYPLVNGSSQTFDKKDAFLNTMEKLRSLDESQTVWIQFLIRPHQRDWPINVWAWRGEAVDTLHQDAVKEIQKIVGKSGDLRALSNEKRVLVESIEAALKRPSYDAGIRAMHFFKHSSPSPSFLDTLFEEHDGEHNSLVAYNPQTVVSWPTSDLLAAIPLLKNRYFIGLFAGRSYFTLAHPGKGAVLNVDEIASLFRIPKPQVLSGVHTSSGTKLEPPTNLPI